MKCLIIGACGFIGNELTKYAREKGHTVLGCDVLPWEGKVQLQFPDKDDYFCVADAEPDNDFLTKADSMVILAGKRPYKDFSYEDFKLNLDIANKYINLAIENGIPNIVFASSKAVYSGNDLPWSEDSINSPSSLYGASKSAVEQLGLYYCLKGNTRFVSLRFAQVIGLGERKGYLINTLIDNAIEKKQQVVYGDGSQYRHYVYVKDVCEAVLKASASRTNGVYNIGMQKTVSNLELAEAVNRAFGNEGNLFLDKSKKMDLINDEMDVGKAELDLDFRAGFDVYEAMADIAKSIRNE